ncbi:FHA domain-containing protein FhaB/FipA [Trueperella pecoris]|uniref:FHA domain-containing protein FhaB/FipA n=1 Tax=Trueperella pecoris TaxID=2733571 RepID=UPI00186BB2D0|nr:FHA domain-containing protein [Trueperella pecoris]QOQ39690.1 FHA domain-containing protein [Trueperella pecoris]
MSAFVVSLLRLGFLALLWVFIFAVLVTIKNDLFGTRVSSRSGLTRSGLSRSSSRAGDPRVSSAQAVSARSGRHNSPLPVPSSAPARTHLVVSGGSLTGSTIPLGTSSVTVGRSPDSALVLDDGYTSARHARFFIQGGEWFVEDLNSTNGTWVGSERIYEPTRLTYGTPVTIGKTTLELRR